MIDNDNGDGEGNPNCHVSQCVYCVDIQGCEDEQDGASPQWPAQASFIITPKAYWEAERKCHDYFSELEGAPRGFHNAAESQWHYNGPINDGAAKLQAAGCEFSETMDKWING